MIFGQGVRDGMWIEVWRMDQCIFDATKKENKRENCDQFFVDIRKGQTQEYSNWDEIPTLPAPGMGNQVIGGVSEISFVFSNL